MYFDKIINTAYSFGAAIVVFGAWGKIEHKDMGDTALTVGLLTETSIFVIYGLMEWRGKRELAEQEAGVVAGWGGGEGGWRGERRGRGGQEGGEREGRRRGDPCERRGRGGLEKEGGKFGGIGRRGHKAGHGRAGECAEADEPAAGQDIQGGLMYI
jgi:hypothetical protein